MEKGYLINEIRNIFNGTAYAIGIECDYEIKDGKIELTQKPRIYFRCAGAIFIYLNNAKMLHQPGEDLKKFRKHLRKLQNNEEYNKKICKHFTELSKTEYPEDVYKDIYYEFN